MSSVVCQGLQSCLEPRLDEPCVSRLDYCGNEDNNNGRGDTNIKNIEKCNKGGWNFIEALVNPSHSTKEVAEKNEEVYVHPLVKRSSSALSSKGLEMCTESLGCETGSDTSSDEISSFSWEREKMLLSSDEYSSVYKEKSRQLDEFSSPQFNRNKSSYRKFTKLNTFKCNFPPPLASISGSNGVEARPHHEGGRLMINAVAVSSCRTYFKADRSNGRLRLSLQRECSVDCDCEMNKKDDKVVYDNEDEEEVLEHENVSEVSDNEDCWDEEMEENNQQVGHEFGIGEFPRPSRCKEGGRGGKEMSNWGPLWVAIS